LSYGIYSWNVGEQIAVDLGKITDDQRLIMNREFLAQKNEQTSWSKLVLIFSLAVVFCAISYSRFSK
jgi:hypothetical protein